AFILSCMPGRGVSAEERDEERGWEVVDSGSEEQPQSDEDANHNSNSALKKSGTVGGGEQNPEQLQADGRQGRPPERHPHFRKEETVAVRTDSDIDSDSSERRRQRRPQHQSQPPPK